MKIITIPRRISTRALNRTEIRLAMAEAGRPLTDEELQAMAESPLGPDVVPPTAEQVEDMARRREDRIDGCVRQRSEDRFPVNFHE